MTQAVGAFLLAALCIALLRTMRRPALRYWAIGWVTLCFSLQGLYLASYYASFSYLGHVVYLLGEYAFGYMVIAGCRSHALGEPPRRSELWLLVPTGIWCLSLTGVAGGNINLLFAVHTLVYPYLFFRALRVLNRVTPGAHSVFGLRVMKLALLLLTIDYLHYAPIFAVSSYRNLRVFEAYLAYAPLYDLIFQVMLMFGMVMLVTGQAQHELEVANADLTRAQNRLEATARVDPLTSALNRRAFDAVIQERRRGGGEGRGVVVVADLDDLKLLNDRHGHAAGDAALCLVAEALRACSRPGDLLFRWGGDEFVLLLDATTEGDARQRFSGLNDLLRQRALPGRAEPVDLRASLGIATFDNLASVDVAIAHADQAMYGQKRTA